MTVSLQIHQHNSFLPWDHFYTFAGCITSDSRSLSHSQWSVGLKIWFISFGASSFPHGLVRLREGSACQQVQASFSPEETSWSLLVTPVCGILMNSWMQKKKCNMNECWMCLISLDFFFFFIDKRAQRRLPFCLSVIAAVVNNKGIEIKRTDKLHCSIVVVVFYIAYILNKFWAFCQQGGKLVKSHSSLITPAKM